MAYRVTEGTIIHSWHDLIPSAAELAETYLRAVANRVQQVGPPVTMAIDQLTSGGWREKPLTCLVIEPTDRGLRHYRTLHYAKASGRNLEFGWYLIGADRADGFSVGIGRVGQVSDRQADEVMSIVETVQTYAVLPAGQEIADRALGGASTPGFFGA